MSPIRVLSTDKEKRGSVFDYTLDQRHSSCRIKLLENHLKVDWRIRAR